MSDNIELTECSICLENIEENIYCTPCNHKFHSNCITIWLEKSTKCPCCRKILHNREINTEDTYLINLQNIFNEIDINDINFNLINSQNIFDEIDINFFLRSLPIYNYALNTSPNSIIELNRILSSSENDSFPIGRQGIQGEVGPQGIQS